MHPTERTRQHGACWRVSQVTALRVRLPSASIPQSPPPQGPPTLAKAVLGGPGGLLLLLACFRQQPRPLACALASHSHALGTAPWFPGKAAGVTPKSVGKTSTHATWVKTARKRGTGRATGGSAKASARGAGPRAFPECHSSRQWRRRLSRHRAGHPRASNPCLSGTLPPAPHTHTSPK